MLTGDEKPSIYEKDSTTDKSETKDSSDKKIGEAEQSNSGTSWLNFGFGGGSK